MAGAGRPYPPQGRPGTGVAVSKSPAGQLAPRPPLPQIQRDIRPTLINGWKFWVPAASINFYFVPLQHQVGPLWAAPMGLSRGGRPCFLQSRTRAQPPSCFAGPVHVHVQRRMVRISILHVGPGAGSAHPTERGRQAPLGRRSPFEAEFVPGSL